MIVEKLTLETQERTKHSYSHESQAVLHPNTNPRPIGLKFGDRHEQ